MDKSILSSPSCVLEDLGMGEELSKVLYRLGGSGVTEREGRLFNLCITARVCRKDTEILTYVRRYLHIHQYICNFIFDLVCTVCTYIYTDRQTYYIQYVCTVHTYCMYYTYVYLQHVHTYIQHVQTDICTYVCTVHTYIHTVHTYVRMSMYMYPATSYVRTYVSCIHS